MSSRIQGCLLRLQREREKVHVSETVGTPVHHDIETYLSVDDF